MRLLALCLAGGIAGFVLARWSSAPEANLRAERTLSEHPVPAKIPVSQVAPDAPNSPKTVQDRLEEAFRGDDSLVAAQRMIDWINQSTAEDFAELAKSPGKFPMPHFGDFDAELRSACFDALAERWLTVDPDGGLRAMKAVCDQRSKDNPHDDPELLKGAARVRPEAVLKDLLHDLQKEKHRWVIRDAFTALGARDPNAARGFLDTLRNPEVRRVAETSIAKGIAQSDPLAAVAIGKRMKEPYVFHEAMAAAERIGPGMVRQVAAAIGEDIVLVTDSATLTLKYPGILDGIALPAEKKVDFYLTKNFSAQADRLSPDERNAALARLENLPTGMREPMVATIASSWARTEPRQAAEWAMARAKPEDRSDPANEASQQVFLRWAYTDPEAAVAWLRSLPASSLRDALGTNACTFIAEQGDLETALTLYRPQPGKEDGQVTAQLVQMFVERDPAKAAEWLRKLPEGASLKDSARTVVDAWYLRDPAEVARWVESLPSGPRRDEATQALVSQAAVDSAIGVTEWIETIADPRLRREAIEQVYWKMRLENSKAADQWMRSLKGVDPEWQARFNRMHQ